MDNLIPWVIEPDENKKTQPELGEVDPLTYPKCRGLMRIISIIEYQEVINKILSHLSLYHPNQPAKGLL